jgi:hypothetical protein
MPTTKELLQEINDLIAVNLDECDKYDYPHVCNMASNPDTRKLLEERLLNMIKASGMTVQEAILQMERAYNPNMLED